MAGWIAGGGLDCRGLVTTELQSGHARGRLLEFNVARVLGGAFASGELELAPEGQADVGFCRKQMSDWHGFKPSEWA